ncbi:MAG: DUF4214 domain-containing protein [Pseudomonadota bacterium]
MSVQEDIAKIYVGYFGRSPEPKGFDYWISEANRGFSNLEIAASFSVQDESTARYPYLANPNVADPAAFVNSVYQNLFNRDPDDEGRDYWVDELNKAQGNPDAVGAMVLNIISGAQNTEQGQDKTIIENKTAVALDWAQSVAEIAEFEYTPEAAASAKSVLDDVDETNASVEAGKAETDAFIQEGAGQVGETITLTPLVDSGAGFVGGNGNDMFMATGDTLNTGDQLNGGEGVDKLSIQGGVFQSIIATPRLTSIEEVEVQGGANNLFAQIDFTTSTGVEKGMLEGVSGTVQFVGVQYPFDVVVANSSTPTPSAPTAGKTALSVDYAPGAVAGQEDVQHLELLNSGLASLSLAGIEHVDVTATGLNYVDAFAQAKTLTVDGTGDLFTSFFSTDATATFDATASTGNMNVAFGAKQDVMARSGSGDDVLDFAETRDVDVNGGDGNDTFFFDGGKGSLTEADVIDGGLGKDTLAVDSATYAPASLVNAATSIEALLFTSAFSGLTASDYTEIDEFIFAGGPNNNRVSINGVESNDRFIFTSPQGSSDKTLNFNGEAVGETLYMELHASSSESAPPNAGAGDRVTVANSVDITANASTGDDVSAVYLGDNLSAVTIASTGSSDVANSISATGTGNENYYAFYNDDGPSAFTIVGNQALSIAAMEGSELDANSDYSGFKDAVNVDASGFDAVLRIALSNGADVFAGGADSDIIYGLGGDDRLTGNDGADQFRYVGSKGTDTILDFLVGDDKIGLNEFDFENTAESYEGTILDADDYIENRDGITEISTADDNTMLELQKAFSTDQIKTDTGADVEAYVLVFNSSTERAEIWHDADWSTSDNRDHIATLDNIVDVAGVHSFSNTDIVEFIA